MFRTFPEHALDNLFPVNSKPYHRFSYLGFVVDLKPFHHTNFEGTTHSVEEYTIGRGEMEDRLILLISPAISCNQLMKFISQIQVHKHCDNTNAVTTALGRTYRSSKCRLMCGNFEHTAAWMPRGKKKWLY